MRKVSKLLKRITVAVCAVTLTVSSVSGLLNLTSVKAEGSYEYETEPQVTKVDFQNEDTGVNVQSATGVIADDWQVDATSGKLYDRGTDAQFNTGTKISIPVSGKGTITIVSYPGYHNYTVAGTAVEANTYDYPYELGSGSDTVEIIATGGSYLYSITKTEYAYKPAEGEFVFNLEDYKTNTLSYDFTANSSKTAPVVGEAIDGTDPAILYMDKGSSSGCTFDKNQLRFRAGVVLYIPLKADTTAITYTLTGSGNNAGRPTYIGGTDSGYEVPYDYSSKLDVYDIDGCTEMVGEQRYLKIISGGDIKIKKIDIVEYNPVNTVKVSGSVGTNATAVIFKNTETEDIYKADVDGTGNYSIDLKRVKGDTTYSIGVESDDYMVDPSDNSVTLKGNGTTFTKDISLVIAPKARLTGKLTGISDASLLKGDLVATLVPSDSSLSSVELNLTKNNDNTYSFENVIIMADTEYVVSLKNADDYEVISKVQYEQNTYSNVEIVASMKATQAVSGKFVTSDGGNADVTSITFTNMDTPDYKYTFSVSGGSYTANLREGEYETSVVSTSGKYSAYDHVSVSDKAVSNDVYLKAPVDTSAVAYQSEIKVGQGEKFETVQSAIDYIARMERGENDRVTVILLDSLYREQVIVDTPNVTIKSARTSGSTISWYYGVGYSYYSAKAATDGKNGSYYDEACAVDKYYKSMVSQNPGHWGATVNLFAGAKGFKADNITFENSFNRYLTTEEVADGVGVGAMNSKVDRSDTSLDVKSKAAKERACVLYIQADDTEYNNCSLLSGQDTLYTGDKTETSYFYNCLIEGNTDYICGDGDSIFDNCTLSMYGYSNQNATDSIIVANKNSAAKGYLFNNCKIVNTSYEGIQPTTSFYLARSWTRGCRNTFLNTEVANDTKILDLGYTNMNGSDPTVSDSYMSEYGTKYADGTAIDLSVRNTGTIILTKEQADAINVPEFLGDFNAIYYYADYTEVDKAIAKVAALDSSKYEDFSAVTAAVAAVERNLGKSEQTKVDAMAEAINTAIKNLKLKEDSKPEDPSEGDIEVNVDNSEDAPEVALPGSVDEIIGDIMTEEEKKAVEGKDVKISLSVDKKDNVTEEEKKAIESKIDSNQIVAMYLDINLFMSVDGAKNAITDTNKALSITINIPENLINTDASKTRKFSVIRIHNGVAEILKTSYDENNNKLTFETDKFSTYVLVYEDTDKESDGTKVEDKAPSTGDAAPIAMLITLLGLSGLGLLSSRKKRV